MTAAEGSPATDENADQWLTPSQLDSWLSVVRLITRLPWAIDGQLQRDADLSMVEYMTMATLAKSPEWTRRMSDLAEETSSSLSRLSHLVKRLESRGYVSASWSSTTCPTSACGGSVRTPTASCSASTRRHADRTRRARHSQNGTTSSVIRRCQSGGARV
jgi:hypothetical protein